MSLLKPLEFKSNLCFTRIFGLNLHKNASTGKLEYSNRPGIKVYPLGDTESTRSNSHCGFDGMCNLLPTDGYFELSLAYFETMRKFYEEMGYVHGLTMQGLPYDWRI